MAWVYIIKSKEGYIYVGSTTNLKKRISQHNNKLAGWTKRGNDWELIYSEQFSDYSEARKKEMWLKIGVGRDFIKNNILSDS